VNRRLLVALPLFLTVCSLGSGGMRGSAAAAAARRPTNVEVRILSQSCFQGEVTPCG